MGEADGWYKGRKEERQTTNQIYKTLYDEADASKPISEKTGAAIVREMAMIRNKDDRKLTSLEHKSKNTEEEVGRIWDFMLDAIRNMQDHYYNMITFLIIEGVAITFLAITLFVRTQ